MSKFFFKAYWTLQYQNIFKNKISKSSYQRLSAYFGYKKVFKFIFYELFKILIFRLIEFKVDCFILEFDDGTEASEEPLNSTEFDLREKYNEIWKNNGYGSSAIYFRYFRQLGRRRLLKIQGNNLKMVSEFTTLEKYRILFTGTSVTFDYMNLKKTKMIRILSAKGGILMIKFPMKLNKSLAYLNSSYKLVLEETDFNFTTETIELFLRFILNLKLMNNLRSFAKKRKRDIYVKRSKKKKSKEQDGKEFIANIYEHIAKTYPGVNADFVRPDIVPGVRFFGEFWRFFAKFSSFLFCVLF